jgi:hypothetical protein
MPPMTFMTIADEPTRGSLAMTHIATIPDTLMSPTNDNPVYRMDRRVAERRDASGEVTALRFLRSGRPCTTTGLQLRNMSVTGIAATSSAPFEIGEAVSLYFGSHGTDCPAERIGTVVRCRPTAEISEHVIATLPATGYEIAIRFDAAAQAAA